MASEELKRETQERIEYVPNLLFEIAHRFIIVVAIAAAYDLTKLNVFYYLSSFLAGILFWPILSRTIPYPPDKATKLGWLRYVVLFVVSTASGGILNHYTLQLVVAMVNAHYAH